MQEVIKKFMGYRKMVEKVTNVAPKRIIFYRGKLLCTGQIGSAEIEHTRRWCF